LRIGYLGSLFATSVMFPALADLDPSSPFAAWILERFDLLPVALWFLPLAAGLARLSQVVRAGVRTPLAVAVGLALACVLLLCVQAFAGQSVSPAKDGAVESYARSLLRTPTPDTRAVILGTDDHRSFPVLFVAEVLEPETIGVEGVRHVDAVVMRYEWHRARVADRHPRLSAAPAPARVVAESLEADPELVVYIANVMSAATARIPTRPEGALRRVLRAAELAAPAAPEAWL